MPLLPADLCRRILSAALARGGDFAEVFAERRTLRSLQYEDGRLKSASEHHDLGVGIRVVAGAATGSASVEGLVESDLLTAAGRAAAIADAGAGNPLPWHSPTLPNRYRAASPVSAVDLPTRLAFLRRAHDRARSADPRISWVSVSLVDSEQAVTVAASDGTFANDHRPMVRFALSVQARDGTRRESGYAGGGGRRGLDWFACRPPESVADLAVRRCLHGFAAQPSPAGPMPVVLAPAVCGTLIHEAVGHGLEGDFARKGVSAYAGKAGQQVASPLVTVIDAGDVPGDRGCLDLDDEGTVPGRTVLIERGELRGYLHDKLSARLMGVAPTGNGRRQDFRHTPIPRMRTTWLAAGDADPADLFRQVKRGLFCLALGGGSVDISKGDFNFEVAEAWLIEDGRVTAPLRGATLIGNGPEAMRRVTAVGNDLQLDDGTWTCGKEGQSVAVGQGQPTVLISELLVGGRV
jgi:TldD protein